MELLPLGFYEDLQALKIIWLIRKPFQQFSLLRGLTAQIKLGTECLHTSYSKRCYISVNCELMFTQSNCLKSHPFRDCLRTMQPTSYVEVA